MPIDVDYLPAWSPDGDCIAVASKAWGSINICLTRVDGSRSLLLTKEPGFEGLPQCSPTGNRLAVVSDREDGTKSIWIIDNLEPYLERLSRRMRIGVLTEAPGTGNG